MRACPNLRVQPYRQPDPSDGRIYSHDINGWYLIPCAGVTLKVIASDGLDPIADGWEHVSVSTATRCPLYAEMEFVRGLFFRDDETVMQLSVPRADHMNQHPFCLHLWRHQSREIPRPPSILVGPK